MKIRLDAERCQGHGRCYALSPQLFSADEEGNAVVIGDGVVPPELEAQAELAADNCPEFAIELE